MIVFFLRTLVLYLLLVGVIRLMGKRQVGQMEPAEFVVTMLSANLVTIPMQDFSVPVYTGVIPIVTVLAMALILSAATVKSVGLRRIFCGKPVILIENGRVLQKNLQKTRISLDELTGQLRLKDILDITRFSMPFGRPTATSPCSLTPSSARHRQRRRGFLWPLRVCPTLSCATGICFRRIWPRRERTPPGSSGS